MENPTDKDLRTSLIENSDDIFDFSASKDSVEITQHDSFLQKSLKLSNLGMLVAASYIGLSHCVVNIEYANQYQNSYQG